MSLLPYEELATSLFSLLSTKEGQQALATLLGDYGIEQAELDALVASLHDPTPPTVYGVPFVPHTE